MATSPAPPQVVVVEPHTIDLTERPLRTEITYAISSLEPEQASAARSGRLLRSHWEIENRLHWVRDVTSDEYHSQIRIGATPSVMACLRNLIIGAVSRAGRSTSPLRCAATPATHADPWPPRDRPRMNRHHAKIAGTRYWPRAPAFFSICLIVR